MSNSGGHEFDFVTDDIDDTESRMIEARVNAEDAGAIDHFLSSEPAEAAQAAHTFHTAQGSHHL